MQAEWRPITDTDPPDGATTATKLVDIFGERKEMRLQRLGQTWFIPDSSVCVHYTPTHYLAEPPQTGAKQ